jgi:hypothetical protein
VSLARLWAVLAVALPFMGALLASMSTVDLAYHLRAGDEIIASGTLPTMDTWTFTAAGEPWADQQWGAQVVLATVFAWAGWSGLFVLRALLVGAIFALIFDACRRRGLECRTAAVLAIGAFLVSVAALALRPQLFGMALLALTLLLVADRRSHPRRVWLVPVVVALWANLHGSFFLGPLVLFLSWLEDLAEGSPSGRHTLGAALVSLATACLSPLGPAVWVYALGLSVNPLVTQRITEWQPTSLRDVPGIVFFASVVAVGAVLARGRATPWPTLVWLVVFFAIGAYAVRGIAWWPLGAAVAIAGLLASGDPRPTARPVPRAFARANLGIGLAVVLAIVALLPVWRPADAGTGAPRGVLGAAPGGIARELRAIARPEDRLFNPQPWGSWFELTVPALPVAIDSRLELFPAQVWDDHDRVSSGIAGWEEVLDRWGVTIAVATADEEGFAARLAAAGWVERYADDDGRILTAPGRSSAQVLVRDATIGAVTGRTALLHSEP